MSDTKFTTGPWKVRQHWSDEGAFEVYPTRDKDPKYGQWGALAEIPEYGPEDKPEANANAHLIAAAPEMFEALKKFSIVFENYARHHALKGDEQKKELNRAHAGLCNDLIAKALGEE